MILVSGQVKFIRIFNARNLGDLELFRSGILIFLHFPLSGRLPPKKFWGPFGSFVEHCGINNLTTLV